MDTSMALRHRNNHTMSSSHSMQRHTHTVDCTSLAQARPLVAAIAEELERHRGGSTVSNWLEAERILEHALSESTTPTQYSAVT